MQHKKTDSNSDKYQLSSSFVNDSDVVVVNETTDNKVIDILPRLKKCNDRRESDARKRSIDKLLNYAEELDW